MAHPQSELYGADRMFLEAVKGMATAGDDVVVTLPQRGPLSDELAELGVSFQPCPTPVVRKSAMTPRGFLSLVLLALTSAPRMWGVLRRVDPDVVYVSTVTAPLWTVMARAARRRVIVHVHEAQVDVPTMARVVLMAPLFAAHRIIVNSRATASVTAHHYRRLERKMSCIYNGVGPPSHTRPPGEPTHDPLRLVVVGRLSAIKGTDVAIDATAELVRRGRQVSLLLVATGSRGRWVQPGRVTSRSCCRPHPTDFPDWHLLPDRELSVIARSFGLVPDAIDDGGLIRFVLPPLRFDLESINGGWGTVAPLDCPVHIIAGTDDGNVSRPVLKRLAADLGAKGIVDVVGPHMFVCSEPEATARALVRIARAANDSGATG